MYLFHPGHHGACHRHKRPIMDWGFLSYFARKPQFPQLDSAIYNALPGSFCLYYKSLMTPSRLSTPRFSCCFPRLCHFARVKIASGLQPQRQDRGRNPLLQNHLQLQTVGALFKRDLSEQRCVGQAEISFRHSRESRQTDGDQSSPVAPSHQI